MSTPKVFLRPSFLNRRDFYIVRPVNMRTCISVDRYGKLRSGVAEPWIDAVNRLLRAKRRPDPKDRTALKVWTFGDLAETAGVRGNTLSDMMNNKREPSVDTLRKIAAALGEPAFVMMMTEGEYQTYLKNQADTVKESSEEAARRDAREYYVSKIDGLFDQWHHERTAPEKPAKPHVVKKKRA